MAPGRKAYFTSDWHLGYPSAEAGLEREKKIVRWLDRIAADADVLFLLGDIFDFWFDYRRAAPRHFVRVLGKLAELHDRGVRLYYFFGNHDMWHRDYLAREIGVTYVPDAARIRLNGLRIYAAHGDGLGPGDKKYKMLKKIFSHPLSRTLYRILHPDWGIPLALWFSHRSRRHTPPEITRFLGPEREHLMIHSRKVLEREPYDYFIFGHRHHAVMHPLTDKAMYINLGDWINLFTYAESDGRKVELKKFEE
ncbi:MAG: UDP-2,3-diacylglucosamine diphosphatase [Chlorobi bacterium]|nr:UDP-2,3-diacylglucosamine diphosphatase [Chlorobiota bacterium]